MPQGTQGNARAKPQTGTARKASKAKGREQMIERTRMIVDNRPLMTVEQVARYLGVSRWTIGRMLDDGELRAHMVGARRKIRPADVDAYLDRVSIEPTDVAQ
jgi:excisionase family DNA binding protein